MQGIGISIPIQL